MLTTLRPRDAIGALQRFVRAQPAEACEFCGVAIPDEHRHLVEAAVRRISCACFACAEALPGRPDRRYRLVPRDAAALRDFVMTDAEWHSLGLPIDIAFIFDSTPARQTVALYPGPLGTAEASVDPVSWQALRGRYPVLAAFEPDVEALLIDRLNGRRAYYRMPIDRCYELVGLIRSHWRGWSGGDEVWQAIEHYFGRLIERSGHRQ